MGQGATLGGLHRLKQYDRGMAMECIGARSITAPPWKPGNGGCLVILASVCPVELGLGKRLLDDDSAAAG